MESGVGDKHARLSLNDVLAFELHIAQYGYMENGYIQVEFVSAQLQGPSRCHMFGARSGSSHAQAFQDINTSSGNT